ncbi:MAG: UbiA family prenyltransferase [Gammaproteobacteria bacterium]|nr:UbiA family prenyltransferase [Gammaproteobacteria bacterium]MDP2348425.1 UbiA family prenyltransferase [Gammaproteobacteria bacterium]
MADTHKHQTPLFVDLDGTLIHSDLLLESFLDLIKRHFLCLFLAPFWLLRGKAWLKYQIASRVELRADLLPYNNEFLDYLREQKAQGRKLILISASSDRLVQSVAAHLALFDLAIGSDDKVNCSGTRKLARILELHEEFTYAGDGNIDLQVWKEAKAAIPVNASESLKHQAAIITSIEREFDGKRGGVRPYLKALRLHQWLKNTLVFLPLVLAHQIDNPELIWQAAVAFVCFGLCASSVYILNDLLDLPSDRQHRSKRNRPFAAGDVPLIHGLLISPALLIVAFTIALTLPTAFVIILALYYLCTGLYSFVLKRIMLVDVIMLAALYTLRIISGAAAISVVPSFWLLAFSMFLFFSLAVVKRYTELDYLRSAGIEQSEGRGYYAQDLSMMAIFGAASAFLSVMVFALYINNDETRNQYVTPEVLWLICPLLLYMITRIWLLAARGQIEEDPIVFALKDRVSQAVTLVCGAMLWLANIDWRAVVL